MQQKLRVLHKTFFYKKNSTWIYETYVGPVSLLFLPKLTRIFYWEVNKKMFFLYLIPF